MLFLKTVLILSVAACDIGKAQERCDCADDDEAPQCDIPKVDSLEIFPDTYVTPNGPCNSNTALNGDISHNQTSPVIINICINTAVSSTLWAKHVINGPIVPPIPPHQRPRNWAVGPAIFYPSINPDNSYLRVNQNLTIDQLLGNGSRNRYFSNTQYLQRGHLAPCGDFNDRFHRDATFAYINAVPTWRSVDGQNWANLEKAVRDIATIRSLALNVWTGTIGVTRLMNMANQLVPIYLGRSNSNNLVAGELPVPHFLWKVIHNPVNKTGVAVITINNPYHNVTSADGICTNVCSQLPWVTWTTTDVHRGYTICCRVDDFQRAVPYAPNLGSLPLFT